MKYAAALLILAATASAQQTLMRTQKPPLHGAHWMAVTGKPLGATAGAMIFQKGGNAVDAAAAMIAADCTMWDTLSWGGETQALIYDPHSKKVVGINALGVAPTGATPEFYKTKGAHPPDEGVLAATTPGTPGGIMTMVAEYGRLSLKEVLGPALQMADGYAIEAQSANTIDRNKDKLKNWPYSKKVFFVHPDDAKHPGPYGGEMFRQPDLAATLRKLIDIEQQALKKGKSRKEAIYAAYDRFYKGDIAKEIVRGAREQGGLFTEEDLANWKVHIEEPISTNYKGIDVYKLNVWTQGAAMLQALNILENFDLKSMGFNSPRYINTIYQTISLAWADRDFYYGDIYVQPEKPVKGLLSKEYAKERAKLINAEKNDPKSKPGDPWPYQGGTNPYPELLKNWDAPKPPAPKPPGTPESGALRPNEFVDPTQALSNDYLFSFYAGTTSVEAADSDGWAVSVTPSGGWLPAVVAGNTGVGLSERMQSFVLDPAEGPYNVVAPGKHPRVTLTPTLALKNGEPWMAFSVQGGDSQDQNLLQFFLDVVEFGMTIQEATEAPNINSFQMHSSFGAHDIKPGNIVLNSAEPPWVRGELRRMGYTMTFEDRTSGPINAILFDRPHGTLWGGSSNHGEDYGIGW
jgi:gamma-glutamyltranspeptidase/glutathione hydrolase